MNHSTQSMSYSQDNGAMVSVIIPCFNSEMYVKETIESLLSQTYTQWECIVIDDGSKDSTADIIRQYIARFPEKFSYQANPGKGACAARNYGMDKASGKYIKFLDSDDALFDETVLEEQVRFLNQTRSDIVFGNEIYYQDKFEDTRFRKKRGKALDETNIHASFFNRFPITSNFLFQIPAIKIRWSEELKSGQEFHFLFMSYLNGLKFQYQDKSIAKIRIHNSENRITNKKPEVYADQTHQLINRMSADIESFGHLNVKFITAFNLWKLRWSYFAYNAKNFPVFKAIQSSLLSLEKVEITDPSQKFLYRLNSFNSYMGFLYYQFNLKVLKNSIL